MHFILGIIGLATGAYFLIMRARNAAEITHELVDVAQDIRSAGRRFGFRRKQNIHPVETIEDPNIAVVTLAVSFLELDDYPSSQQKEALSSSLASGLSLPEDDIEEMMILARWLMTESSGATGAIQRVSRKLYKLDGADKFVPLMSAIKSIGVAGNGQLTQKQLSALEDIQTGLRIK